MKTTRWIWMVAGVFCISMTVACGTTKEMGEVELPSQPCSDCGFSTETVIRATGSGESRDKLIALERARNNALTALGSQIRVSIEEMAEGFSVSRKENENEDIKRIDMNIVRRIVDETIQGYRTICEKYTVRQQKDGTKIYTCYYAVELGKEDAASSLYRGLTLGTTSLDMDYEKFRMKFQQELMAHESKN